MRLMSVLLLAVLGVAPGLHGAPSAVPNDAAAITHALNRLAFGARPGDVKRVKEIGLARWIDQQLQPATVANDALTGRLARFKTLNLDPTTIARDYFLPARQERRARQQAASSAAAPVEMTPSPAPPAGGANRAMSDAVRQERRIFAELAEAKLVRAVYSERQLEEVLVDFWFNHFNVFARKGQTEIYVGAYEREAIRPNILGKFRTLLGATAKSPAMLFYLDNVQSVAPQGRLAMNAQRPRGLNENYARELLELHTLGVDGGYTQDDIVNVARAFTGWTIGRPAEAGFRFAQNLHDRDPKVVLGQTLNARGVDDGERVLDLLARHPSTARHIAFKLAQRFVSDVPPPALIDRAAETFRRTDGDLHEVLRTIVTSAEFFAPAARLAKVKTPFEFVTSALRAGKAEIQSGQAVLRALAEMGMPLYLCQPPTGYDETAATWVSSGALVSRINFAVALSRGEVRGVQLASTNTRREAGDPLQFGAAEFQRQ